MFVCVSVSNNIDKKYDLSVCITINCKCCSSLCPGLLCPRVGVWGAVSLHLRRPLGQAPLHPGDGRTQGHLQGEQPLVDTGHVTMSSSLIGGQVNFGEDEDGEEGESLEAGVTSVVSTPDIPAMMDTDTEPPPATNGGGGGKMNGVSGRHSPGPGLASCLQPEVILDTEVVTQPKLEPAYSSACLQCSLCTMVLPSSSYMSHLRTFHRVSCPLTSAHCPLCMSLVPIMDLTVHLASQHGLVPQVTQQDEKIYCNR